MAEVDKSIIDAFVSKYLEPYRPSEAKPSTGNQIVEQFVKYMATLGRCIDSCKARQILQEHMTYKQSWVVPLGTRGTAIRTFSMNVDGSAQIMTLKSNPDAGSGSVIPDIIMTTDADAKTDADPSEIKLEKTDAPSEIKVQKTNEAINELASSTYHDCLFEHMVGDMIGDRDASNLKVRDLELQVKRLEQELEHAKNAENLSSRLHSLEKTEFPERLKKLEGSASSKDHVDTSLSMQYKALKESCKSLANTNASQIVEINKVLALNRQLTAKNETLENANERLKRDNARHMKLSDDMASSNVKLVLELDGLEKEKCALSKAKQVLITSVKDLEDHNKSLLAKNEKLEAQVEMLEEQIKEGEGRARAYLRLFEENKELKAKLLLQTAVATPVPKDADSDKESSSSSSDKEASSSSSDSES